MKIQKNKNLKTLICHDNAKISSLGISIYIYLLLLFLLLIGIILLRPYVFETSYLY